MNRFAKRRQPAAQAMTWLLCLSLLTTALSGCQGETTTSENTNGERAGGTIRVAVACYPAPIDPFVGWDFAADICSHVTEQLITYDEDWQIIPQLADDYFSSPDYTEWTFQLRQGVLFQNGEEMTAEDVKASIERWQKTSARAPDLGHLAEIRTPDKYTVTLVLSRPDPLVPVYVAFPSAGIHIVPKSVLDTAEGFSLAPEQIIGTGPYMIADAVPDRHIRLVRFDGYQPDQRYQERTGYGGYKIAYADEIDFIPVPDASARTAGLLAGDYDFAEDLPRSDYDTLVNCSDVQVLLNPTKYQPNLSFRNKPGAPFGNIYMRKAVQAALNMDQIMLAAAERAEFYRLESSQFTRESVWHYPAGEKLGLYNLADADLARTYLEKAGYQGEEIIILACNDYDWIYREGVVIADQLKKVGLNIKLEVYDWATIASLRNDTDKWDLFCSGDTILDNDGSYLNYWHTDQDWLGYSNPKIDALIEEGMRCADFEDRYPVYCRLLDALYEDVAWIILGNLATLNAASSNLRGYVNHAAFRFCNVWLEK